MSPAFESAINALLDNEGGYVNNPNDPGGETKFGISKRAYPEKDIASLTRDQAAEIYRMDFWDRIDGDSLPPQTAFQMLDFAVNAGMETAVRKAQDVAGVADDGHWGPVTKAAIAAMNEHVFAAKYAAMKLRYYARLTTFPTFGAGWTSRVAADLDRAFSGA